jgi:Ca-activated chloride channel homolog
MLGIRRTDPRKIILDDYHTLCRRRKKRRTALLTVTCLVSALFLLGWHQSHAGMHSGIGSSDPQSAQAGQLLFKSGASGDYVPASMLQSRVHFTVSGMISHATLTQSFRNDSQHWVEAVYVFPLPEKAAVNRLRMTIGERVIEGSITEREQAKAIYLKAKASGKKTSLLEQQRPNMFTASVANIAPGETIVVNIEYLQTLEYQEGVFTLRFPMTITPRFMPGTSLDEFLVADASAISPFVMPDYREDKAPLNPISISASIDIGMPVTQMSSESHEVVFSPEDMETTVPYRGYQGDVNHRYRVQLKKPSVSMDRDFVMSWQPQVGAEPRAAVFSERVDGEDYALMMVVPPSMQQQAPLAREVIYIIDTSGSMGGVSIEQAKQGLLIALENLRPEDRFNIIEFNSQYRLLFTQALVADQHAIGRASQFVKQLQANGGTDMLPALDAALTVKEDSAFFRQVIFITDGAVGNEDALFKLIHKKLGNSRLFTVAIGSAPSAFFMRKAAQLGRGTLTQINSVAQVNEKMSLLFSKLDSPITRNIQVRWPGGESSNVYPQIIPDLYRNEPLLIMTKVSDLVGDVIVQGSTAQGDVALPWERAITVQGVANHKGVATLWAREKIAGLLDEKIMGRDADAVRADVVSVALQHQLLSPYTSFVAVENDISRTDQESLVQKPVPNAQPAGQSPQYFAYPRTATNSAQSIAYGIALLFMSMIFFMMMVRDEELLPCKE